MVVNVNPDRAPLNTRLPLTYTFDDVRFKLPAALNNILLVDVSSADPEPVAINVFATTLPDTNTFVAVKLIAPAAVIFKLPVDVIVAAVAVGERIVLAITLPALILPVYVAKNAPTLALANDGAGDDQYRLPVPFVVKDCPLVPSVCGHA